MMSGENRYGWRVRGLRAKYRSRPQIHGGLTGAAPWLTAAFLVIMFLMLAEREVLRPGLVVTLPQTEFTAGTGYGLTAVVLSRESTGKKGREEIVFFDDDPFDTKVAGQMSDLRHRLIKSGKLHQGVPLIIEADVNVKHGTIMTLCKMAVEAGFEEVNLAARLEEKNAGD